LTFFSKLDLPQTSAELEKLNSCAAIVVFVVSFGANATTGQIILGILYSHNQNIDKKRLTIIFKSFFILFKYLINNFFLFKLFPSIGLVFCS